MTPKIVMFTIDVGEAASQGEGEEGKWQCFNNQSVELIEFEPRNHQGCCPSDDVSYRRHRSFFVIMILLLSANVHALQTRKTFETVLGFRKKDKVNKMELVRLLK